GSDDITRLHVEVDLFCGFADGGFYGLYEATQLDGFVVTDVIEAVGDVTGGDDLLDADDALNDVIDVGKVPLHLAMVKDLDGLVIKYGLGKEPRGHIWSSCRSIDSKKA